MIKEVKEGSNLSKSKYLMEHEKEAQRLDQKTDRERLSEQALWAGLRPGMRVADIGCGSGKTTGFLHSLVQPGGSAMGVDASAERIAHAQRTQSSLGATFVCRNIYAPLEDLGTFDFIWSRFFLEYHRQESFAIVQRLTDLLQPGGIMCLVDLDYNCLSHYGLPARLEKTVCGVMKTLEQTADFDPYVGRKLYAYLYDLGYEEIRVEMSAHHLIYGELDSTDAFNWATKVEVAAQNSGYPFSDYPGGYDEFRKEFMTFFQDPRRFTYTPLIACRGRKPMKKGGQ